ncbi:mitochondrial ribosomal protein L11 [Nomia melanderi]|uniref:mitochondrial ribosomal protein L11 n=1 Tax=Nomia melanderi TaxID=2448451 RepID=UPI00130477F8|nr:39S ribosomal protein L11, mitochondrial-like [Nomia melanderi]
MSKILRKGQMAMKAAKVDHSSKLRVIIPAGMASAKPPLGSQLGQRNINVVNFCKEFNQRTENIKQGIPLPCRVKVKENNTFDLVIHNPPATYFLKHAAGIEKGRMCKGEIAGKITFKHLYEIARIKATDPPLALMTLQQICQMLVGIARSCGIEVVRSLDPVEYEEFMKQREENVRLRKEEAELSKQTKLLRTV